MKKKGGRVQFRRFVLGSGWWSVHIQGQEECCIVEWRKVFLCTKRKENSEITERREIEHCIFVCRVGPLVMS